MDCLICDASVRSCLYEYRSQTELPKCAHLLTLILYLPLIFFVLRAVDLLFVVNHSTYKSYKCCHNAKQAVRPIGALSSLDRYTFCAALVLYECLVEHTVFTWMMKRMRRGGYRGDLPPPVDRRGYVSLERMNCHLFWTYRCHVKMGIR